MRQGTNGSLILPPVAEMKSFTGTCSIRTALIPMSGRMAKSTTERTIFAEE